MTAFHIFPSSQCSVPLWIEAFGDCEEFVRAALGTLGDSAVCAAICEGEEVLSQCLLIEHTLGDARGLYVYAACTDSARRGEGLFSLLLSHVAEYARVHGYDFVSLIPASKSLEGYYKKRGFTLSAPLSASAAPTEANDLYLTLDPGKYRVLHCTEQHRALYRMSKQSVSPNVFEYICETLSEICEVCTVTCRDGRSGYVIRHKERHERVFDTSANLADEVSRVEGGADHSQLFIMTLTGKAKPAPADPLPR